MRIYEDSKFTEASQSGECISESPSENDIFSTGEVRESDMARERNSNETLNLLGFSAIPELTDL